MPESAVCKSDLPMGYIGPVRKEPTAALEIAPNLALHRGLFPIRYVELIELVPPDTGDGPQRSSSPWLSSSKRKERRRSFASVESLPTLDDDQQHAESERAPFCIAEEGTLRRKDDERLVDVWTISGELAARSSRGSTDSRNLDVVLPAVAPDQPPVSAP